MSFKEIFKRYQQGTATKEEQVFIENELEKNELINDYLSEKLLDNINIKYDTSSNQLYDAKKIKKRINRKFVITTIVSVVLVALLASIIKFIALPIYDKAFYNPNIGYKSTPRNSQLFYDINAFMRLHSPGFIVDYANAESLGLGKYTIEVCQRNLFNSETELFKDTLVKGKFATPPFTLNKLVPFGVFYDKGSGTHITWRDKNGDPHEEQSSEKYSYYINELNSLPKTAYISAFFSFKNELSMQEFIDMEQANNKLMFNWVAVRHSKYEDFVELGFVPLAAGAVVEEGIIPSDEFPCYELRNEHYPYSANTYSTHMKTLLKYISTRTEFLNAFGNTNGLYADNYKRSYNYLVENGVKTYGVLVTGNVTDILKFAKQDYINSIKVNNVKLSVLSD